MLRRLARSLVVLAGVAAGPGIVAMIYRLLKTIWGIDPYVRLLPVTNLIIFLFSALIFGILFYILAPGWMQQWVELARAMEKRLREVPAAEVIVGAAGLIIGLVIAFLLVNIISMVPIVWLQLPISISVYALLGFLGVRVSVSRYDELVEVTRRWRKGGPADSSGRGGSADMPSPKVLDTSAIIDGRIFDIARAGFLEGQLIVPGFVLTELRHIADSSDAMRRGRGRRGLEVLRRMREELKINILVDEQDYEDIAEVDQKLIRLAAQRGAKVLTNDFNLNRVAGVQGVAVLNVNELSLATKPPLLSGEELMVQIVKEGKEAGQGVAYLEDGTMVVIEGGSGAIGRRAAAVVASVIQTAAGRMVFARLKNEQQGKAV